LHNKCGNMHGVTLKITIFISGVYENTWYRTCGVFTTISNFYVIPYYVLWVASSPVSVVVICLY